MYGLVITLNIPLQSIEDLTSEDYIGLVQEIYETGKIKAGKPFTKKPTNMQLEMADQLKKIRLKKGQ